MKASQSRIWLLLVVAIFATGAGRYGSTVTGEATATTTTTETTPPSVLALQQQSGVKEKQNSATSSKSSSYDYIIVGGGLAGCLLAERLSQNADKTVLLLEAGGDDSKKWSMRIPASGWMMMRLGQSDWKYESSGEQACHGRNIVLRRGKTLGGSSCTFDCLCHRGSAMDYDQWNVPGWSSADVLPFFKAIEGLEETTTTAAELGLSSEFHGKAGDWTLEHVRYQNPLSKRFLEVAEAAGLGSNNDFNDWSRPQDGAGRFHVSQRNGERCSGALAFLEKARKRSNLTIQPRAIVRKIEFDETKTATDVVYNRVGDDTYHQFSAALATGGEVILTAGPIGSPQILMCSGVGPARHLRTMGIPIVHDNPNVGDNLQDHPAAFVSFESQEKGVSITSKLFKFGMPNPFPFLQWVFRKKGPLTSAGWDHGAFVRVSQGTLLPDLQLRFLADKAVRPDGKIFQSATSVDDGYTFQSVAIRSKSKGRVRLASSNSHTRPIIDLGYLSNPCDVATLREGIKLARVLGRRPEWREFLGREVYPGPEIQTDDQIDEYIRNTVHSTNALTGTCRMGLGADAVVSPDLELLGVNSVRVADSSVVPFILGGQIATPTVMIAERAAHLVRNPTRQDANPSSDGESSPVDSPQLSEISTRIAMRGGFLAKATLGSLKGGTLLNSRTRRRHTTFPLAISNTDEEKGKPLPNLSDQDQPPLWSEMLRRFQGDFDNYDQVVQDRKQGKLPREGGGHENIHCTLVPVEKNTRLAAFYFDGQPQAIYRFRYYVLEPVGASVQDEASAMDIVTAVDTMLFTLHPELEKQLRLASMAPTEWPRIFRDFSVQGEDKPVPKTSILENCEVRWSYNLDPQQHSYVPESHASPGDGIHAVMVHGEALVESQMMPGRQILIRDQLSLWPDELWIHDRGLDPISMAFIYGNQDGVPYRLKRVCNFESADELPVKRICIGHDLKWTLGPEYRTEALYDAKLEGMDGPSRNANVQRPPKED